MAPSDALNIPNPFISKHTGKNKSDYEKIQQGVFGLVKKAFLNTDLEKETAENIRIKGLGIFRASEGAIKYYKSKFKPK
jgi:hypothetical protein